MKNTFVAALLLGGFTLNVMGADIATVNGKPVTQSLVDYVVRDATARGQKVDDKLRANIIEKLITSSVIEQEAQKSGIEKDPDFIVREELTMRELRVNAYLEDFIKKHPIDDKTLQAEYDKLKGQFGGKEYKASHILVKTEAEAKSLVDQLSKGADFAQLAKDQSLDSGSKDTGGDLGWFSPAAMVKPFGDAVSKLEKGLYTKEPVQTEFGWHVIRLDDTRDTQPPSFDAVKNDLRNDLQRRQLEKMVSDLRAKAKIVNSN